MSAVLSNGVVATDQLAGLPSGWEWKTVGEMLQMMQYGTSAKTSEDSTGTPVLRMGNIKDGGLVLDVLKYLPSDHAEFPAILLADGDILFNRTNSAELVGKSAVYRGNPPVCACASYIIQVRLKDGYVPEYLAWYINSTFGRQWVRSVVSQQVGQANVNGTKLKALAVPVPSLDEQRRIVAEIEQQFTQLEAGVSALRQVQAKLKRYRATVLKAACEGRLVSTEAELARQEGRPYEPASELLARILTERQQNWQGRGKYKEPSRAFALTQLPEGWVTTSVEQLLAAPLCNGVSVKGSDIPPGIRALRLSAMSDYGFDYSKVRYLPLAESDVEDLWISEGDFFMSRGNGSLHLVGRGTRAQESPEPTIFPDTMIRLRLAKAIESSGWISMVWSSRIIREQIEKKVKTTAGIYKISQPQVEEMILPLPPFDEQVRVVAEVERRLSVVNEAEAIIARSIQRAARLRHSILNCNYKFGDD